MSEYIVDFGSLAMLSRVVESESNRLMEPIVRCRDCKYFTTNIHGSYCTKSITTLYSPDGFCALAERRDA